MRWVHCRYSGRGVGKSHLCCELPHTGRPASDPCTQTASRKIHEKGTRIKEKEETLIFIPAIILCRSQVCQIHLYAIPAICRLRELLLALNRAFKLEGAIELGNEGTQGSKAGIGSDGLVEGDLDGEGGLDDERAVFGGHDACVAADLSSEWGVAASRGCGCG